MSADGANWWQRMVRRSAEAVGVGLAAFLRGAGIVICTVATITIADRAPGFAAIVIAGALVALAIYKRPPTAIHQHFETSELTLEGARVDLSTAYALKAVQEIVEAAKNLPEKQGNAR